MSLINQMLQDLEQRRAQTATPNGSPLVGLAPSGTVSGTRNSLNRILLGAVMVLVLMTGYLIWMQRAPLPVAVSIAPAMSVAEESLVVVAEPEKAIAPVAQPVVAEMNEVAVVTTTEPPAVEATVVAAKVIEKKVVAKKPIEKKPAAVTVSEPILESESTEPQEPQLMEKRQIPLTPEQRAQQSFQQAVTDLGRGRQPATFVELTEALQHDPTHLRAREMLAALQLNTGRMSEAEATLREGLALNTTAAPLAKLYARIKADQNDTAGAIAVLEQALPNATADADYLALMAALLARAGRHAEAVQGYEMTLRLRPDAGPWWMGMALSLEAQGNAAQALSAYEQARRGGVTGKVATYVDSRIAALKAALPAVEEK